MMPVDRQVPVPHSFDMIDPPLRSRITGLSSFDFHRVLDGRSWNPSWRWRERRVPLVHVVTEDGRIGVGEGWSDDNDTAPFHARFALVAPLLLGADASLIEANHATLWSDAHWSDAAVASAIDIALWDLHAKSLDAALYVLPGACRHAAPVYASGGLYADDEGPDELATEMRRYVALGFPAVKLKIGALPMADDIARVAAVRDAVGSNVAIIVDALGLLTRGTASAWLEQLAAQRVRAIQAPLPVDDIDGLVSLQRSGGLTVIAGEGEFRHDVLHRLVRQSAVGMLQINAGLCGGITGALKLIACATAAGISVTTQCHGTAVLQAASLHLGAARRAVSLVEFHMFHTHLHAALPPGMQLPREGCMDLDERPGLGIDDGVFAPSDDVDGTVSPAVTIG
jgi:D-arabinonate dehydratase